MKLRSALTSLDARDRRALILGAWVLVPLLIAVVLIRPYVRVLLEQREALASERTLLARENRALLHLPDDRRSLASLDSELSTLAPRLFAGSDAVTASAELARYAAERAAMSRLRLAQVETEMRVDSTLSGGDLRVSLRARGDILAIHEFLRSVESGPKLVRVERVEVVRGSDGGDSDAALTFTARLGARARSTLGLTAIAMNDSDAMAPSLADTADAEELALRRDPFRAGGLLPNAVARLEPAVETVLPVSIAAVRLLGTVVRGNGSFALCQLPADIPRIVHVGERLGELTLISLEQGRVVFEAPRGARLELLLSNTRS